MFFVNLITTLKRFNIHKVSTLSWPDIMEESVKAVSEVIANQRYRHQRDKFCKTTVIYSKYDELSFWS